MKNYYQSKRFWFNALTLITVIATHFFGYTPNDGVADFFTSILNDPFVVAGINFVLTMFFSKQGIKV